MAKKKIPSIELESPEYFSIVDRHIIAARNEFGLVGVTLGDGSFAPYKPADLTVRSLMDLRDKLNDRLGRCIELLNHRGVIINESLRQKG